MSDGSHVTPADEARGALHCGASREGLSPAGRAEYDRMLALVMQANPEIGSGTAAAATAFADVMDEERFPAPLSPGCRVRYANPDAGYPGEQKDAAERLTLGEVYVITLTDVGQSKTYLTLAGIEGRYNSVLFNPETEESEASRRTAPMSETEPRTAYRPQRPCPTCGAEPGQPCRILLTGLTTHPHAARREQPRCYAFTRDQLIEAISHLEAYPATAGPGHRVFISAESMADGIIEALEIERRRSFRASLRDSDDG
jgi:hypothetical protein